MQLPASFPADYLDRVYAGVLGKIIGVYLGRPFEGWSYEKIMAELGEVDHYVHDKLEKPLVVTDDDISGTFTFLRALPDHGNSLSLTPQQIGQTWLNYLIEKQTILWWGGLGNSTEHTAFLRLKKGIPAPESGSIALNGPIVAQQIGSQIFIDGWAMVAPGDPERAADLAKRAGSVSHDGEAIYGAQVLAAMEAQAFVESDINCLLDTGLSFIPKDSVIYRMIGDLRDWQVKDGDWRKTRERIVDQYGYKDFIGGCHMVPNHALIILGLLYGEGDFQKSLMICNTSGWDTDCNSGNLGCLLGIRNGLAGFEGSVDWRGPVADRIYLPTADGGRCVTDAVSETLQIVNSALQMNGTAPLSLKDGARFHFELPGSLQAFQVENGAAQTPALENVLGHSRLGKRSLAVHADSAPVRAQTATFILPDDFKMPGYSLIASPTLYPGQVIRAAVSADSTNSSPVRFNLSLNFYNADDQPETLDGPVVMLDPGTEQNLSWTVPELIGKPIFSVGFSASTTAAAGGPATVYLDYLTWDGVPSTTFTSPAGSRVEHPGPQMWRNAWVNAVEQWEKWYSQGFKLIQNEGRGLLITGTREWKDYRVSATIRPALVKAGGLAARVQGLSRFYALFFAEGGKARLVRVYEGEETILAESSFDWQLWQSYPLALEVKGSKIRGWVDGSLLFDVEDQNSPLTEGAIGLVVEEGHLMADGVTIQPV